MDDALSNALSNSGRSIVADVFVFSLGFLALLLSSFKPIVDLGALVGFSLFISGVMSLFVITLIAPWLITRPELGTGKIGIVTSEVIDECEFNKSISR